MEWLLIFALGFWLYLQSNRVDVLSKEIARLKERYPVAPDVRPPFAAADQIDAAAEAEMPQAAAAASVPAILKSEAEDIDAGKAAENQAESTPALPEIDTSPIEKSAPQYGWRGVDTTQSQKPSAPVEAVTKASSKPQKDSSRTLERWLSENGLAWLGGGALALGGVFLIAYASQRGFFTPAMRLIAALAVGFVLLGASEWVRRASRGKPGNHPLVAALLAGAGAATLYATSWGAFGLYHYIDWGVAACALMACAALLLGLSLLHGEAIGALALAAAFLTPLLTGKGYWPPNALMLYVMAVGAAGYGVSAMRRWGWVAAATTLGLYSWFAISMTDAASWRPLTLLCFAAFGAAGMAMRADDPDSSVAPQTSAWVQARSLMPSIAIAVSSLLMLAIWSRTEASAMSVAGPSLAGLVLVLLAAFGARARIMHPAALALALIMPAAGALYYQSAYFGWAPATPASQFFVWSLVSSSVIALTGVAGIPRTSPWRWCVSFAAAASSLILLLLGVFSQAAPREASGSGVLFAGVLLFLLVAHFLSRSAEDETKDLGLDAWVAAAGVAAIVAAELAFGQSGRILAMGTISLSFAGLYAWRGWRAAPQSALLASALCLAHGFWPSFVDAAMNSPLALGRSLGVLALAAAALLGASLILRRRSPVSHAADSISTAAIMLSMLGAFLGLRWIASGGAGAPLDPFMENSLRALLLMAAGTASLPRPGVGAGIITRIRGHVFLAVGLWIGLIHLGFASNPWWGMEPASVFGPPILNPVALAFAGPAILAGISAMRLYGRKRTYGRVYALAAGLLAAIWILLEIRRAFHGDIMMSRGAIGLLEATAYGLTALFAGLAVVLIARLRHGSDVRSERPFSQDLASVSSFAAIGGISISVLILGLVRNPWWGSHDPSTTEGFVSLIAVAAQIVAAVACATIARAALAPEKETRFVAIWGTAFYGVSFGLLSIRCGYHFDLMDNGMPLTGLEGFGYSLWPLMLFVAAALGLSKLVNSETRSIAVDDAAAAVKLMLWPALLWLGYGMWLLFNPWWGTWRTYSAGWIITTIGLTTYFIAAALSAGAGKLSLSRTGKNFGLAAKLASLIHVFIGMTLVVRCLYRGPDMRPVEMEASLETWTYSAVWALFGAGLVGVGTARQDAVLRWAGLALLLATTAKVFLIDMQRLDGVIRAASFLGVGGVLVLVALAARRFGKPEEGEAVEKSNAP